jgi:hypothetical protein
MQLRHYAAIRGMSNRYNGWGAEDADLYERIKRVYGGIKRLDPLLGHYIPMEHRKDEDSQVHPQTKQSAHETNMNVLETLKQSFKYSIMDQDGYSQMQDYARLISVEEEGIGEHVVTALVDILEHKMVQVEC